MADPNTAGIPDGESVELSLPGDPAAVRQARAVVRATLTRWRLPHLVEVCVLAVSELVTNAVRHGRPPVGVRLWRRDRNVGLDVQDRGEGREVAPRGEGVVDLRESGRGLAIVEAVADEVEAVSGEGTTVTASWRIEQAP